MSNYRPVWAEVDLGAVRDNVRALAAHVAPARVIVVVKADGYGHGAVPVSWAALNAGASALAVALVEEGVALREAGIDAPVLVLSEPVAEAAETVVHRRLTPVVYTPSGVEALAKAASAVGADAPVAVHLKVDTGMHRVGCRPEDAPDLARQICSHPELALAGTLTHFAVADEPGRADTAEQLARFARVLATLRGAGIDPGTVHTCNTAGALALGDGRYDAVRVGIGVYGVAPAPALAGVVALRPVLAVKARVSFVKHIPAGAGVSYGLRYVAPRDTRLATVPIGYADGVPRALGERGGEVLVHGRRCPIAGTVTMDQLMVDVGDLPVQVGDEVVLIGEQGGARVTAAEWAERVGTIPYEIVCGIGPRVPRRYRG
ncbi:MAG: alanine racemase [Acidimicrobiia bacterium]|nr:MAG: alanine racemase [Acidimicrobiia bacterium]